MSTENSVPPDDEMDWDVDPNPEMVRWQPTHAPDGGGDFSRSLTLSPAGALGLIALGSTIVGAVAIGALAIGALAIGRLAVGDARFRRLEVDELVIGKVRWRR